MRRVVIALCLMPLAFTFFAAIWYGVSGIPLWGPWDDSRVMTLFGAAAVGGFIAVGLWRSEES